ncbi:MAG: hypothetical protein ABIR80_17855 [Opitutaceae bacterium]
MSPPHQSRSRRARITKGNRLHARRGAALIVALIAAALIAIVLASYLNLNLSSARLSKRTFNGYAALNLAESGAEEALWSFNRASQGDTTAWDGWTATGAPAWRKFPNFDFGGNTTGSVKVYVDSHLPSGSVRPKIITQASIGAPGDTPAIKMVEVTLRRRSFFANGIVAKESVAFAGASATLDSWNSDPDHDPLTPPIGYDPGIRRANGTVASTSVVNTAVLVNQAHIWGFVATGGAQPQVGASGTIRGPSTPVGVSIDPQRISTDFNAEFPLVAMPLDGTVIATLGATLGTAGIPTKWRTPEIRLNGNQTLTILGDVTLTLTAGPGAQAIDVTGNASIIVPSGSTLTVYVEGDVRIAGNGLANANAQPISCQIFGTNQTPSGQTVQIAGNGALKCALYAPNGNVSVNGNGDIMGSIVARNITLVGIAAFHYDESLADRDSNEPFRIGKWRELTTAGERAPYSALFEGW